jgi:hypothetical protein
MTFTELAPAPSDPPEPFTDRLRLAVAAYLARFKGSSREHTESDLRCYLAWCAGHGPDPLAAQRPHLELYIRWMQEIRRFKPSTVSRRFSVAAGFYRTCVLDGLIEHSPAEHVRRPTVPAESPTLGPRTCSSRPCLLPPGSLRTRATSRWWPCSACWACGSSKLPARISLTSARSMATGSCAYAARAPRLSWSRCRRRSAGQSTGQPASGNAGRFSLIPVAPGWTGTRPPAAVATSPRSPASRSPGHTRTCSVTPMSRPCSTLALTCVTCRSPPATPTRGPRCGMRAPRAGVARSQTPGDAPTLPK